MPGDSHDGGKEVCSVPRVVPERRGDGSVFKCSVKVM